MQASSTPVNWAIYLGGPAEVVRQATMILSASSPVHFRESRVIEFSGPGERYQTAIDSGISGLLPTEMFLVKQCASLHGMEARQIGRYAARFDGDLQSDLQTRSGSFAFYPTGRSPLNLKELLDAPIDDGLPISGHIAHHLSASKSISAWRMLPHRPGTAPAFPVTSGQGAHQCIDSQRESIQLAQTLAKAGNQHGEQVPDDEFRRQVFEEAGYARYAIQTNELSDLPRILAKKFPGLVVAAVSEEPDSDQECEVWQSRGAGPTQLLPSIEEFLDGEVEWFNERNGGRPIRKREIGFGSTKAWDWVQCQTAQLLLGEATFFKAVAQSVCEHRRLKESDPQRWESHQILASIRRDGLDAWLKASAADLGVSRQDAAGWLIERNPRGICGYGVADACLAHENLTMQPAQLEAASACDHPWVDKVADLMHPRQQNYPLSHLYNSIDHDPKTGIEDDGSFSIKTDSLDADYCGSEPAYLLLQRLTADLAQPGPNLMARVLASDCGMLGSAQAGHYLTHAAFMDVGGTCSSGVRAMLAEMPPDSQLARAIKSTGEELCGLREQGASFRITTGMVGQDSITQAMLQTLNVAQSWFKPGVKIVHAVNHGTVVITGGRAKPIANDSELSERFVKVLTTMRLRTTPVCILDKVHVEHTLLPTWKARNAAAGLIGVAGTTWGQSVSDLRKMLYEHGVPQSLIMRSIAASQERVEQFCAAGGDPFQLVAPMAEVYQTKHDFEANSMMDPRQNKGIPEAMREAYAKFAAAWLLRDAIQGAGVAPRLGEQLLMGKVAPEKPESRKRIRL